jgi:UDP-N-acetylmuramoylalanine--D-glutamate ligase
VAKAPKPGERRALSIPALLRGLPKPIGLLGFGDEGRATLQFLHAQGVRGVHVFDRSPRAADECDSALLDQTVPHLGDDYRSALGECRTIVRSPGIRPDIPELVQAARRGAHITSALRLFLAASPGKVVGVTGTLGKGTTVALIGAALIACGVPNRLGGNLGTNPLLFLDRLLPSDVTVLELSSFQLMDLETDWPDVAVILRTTSEHLDWHRDTREYRAAKARLIAPPEQRQRLIVLADAEGSRETAGARFDEAWHFSLSQAVTEGIGPAGGSLARMRGGRATPLPDLERLALPGTFNRENAAAALLAVEALGVSPGPALAAIAGFPGLPHRMEQVAEVGGVLCVNDSYATRPEAAQGAVEFYRERPLSLILGGSEKHASFEALAAALAAHPALKRVCLIGATAGRLEADIQAAARRAGKAAPPCLRCDTLEGAFASGMDALADTAGGVLLLSPACASFGLFANYKVRGERFRALVKEATRRDGLAARQWGPA